MKVVALVPDLLDRSRLQAAIGGRHDLVFASSAGQLVSAMTGAVAVLVDLARPDALDAVAAAARAGARTIGFGPHVDGERLAAAVAAGCDEVLPRSQFFRRLPTLVP